MRGRVILITFSLQSALHMNAVVPSWLFRKEKVEGKGRKKQQDQITKQL